MTPWASEVGTWDLGFVWTSPNFQLGEDFQENAICYIVIEDVITAFEVEFATKIARTRASFRIDQHPIIQS